MHLVPGLYSVNTVLKGKLQVVKLNTGGTPHSSFRRPQGLMTGDGFNINLQNSSSGVELMATCHIYWKICGDLPIMPRYHHNHSSTLELSQGLPLSQAVHILLLGAGPMLEPGPIRTWARVSKERPQSPKRLATFSPAQSVTGFGRQSFAF